MSSSLRIAACILFAAATLWAQEQTIQDGGAGSAVTKPQQQHRARAAQVSGSEKKKKAPMPSIIQSELERSRAEAMHEHPAAVQAASQSASKPAPVREPLWPIALSVLIAACATAAIVYFLFLKKAALFSGLRPVLPGAGKKGAGAASMAAARPESPAAASLAGEDAAATLSASARSEAGSSGVFSDEDLVTSASPYASEEETETPEAALTMNLINKKRETKKEVMQDVMRRVQRKEKPQEIAEELRVGIGEVHLAMTLEKLKK